jgi:thiol-disulfide isomerase/thioredoxin
MKTTTGVALGLALVAAAAAAVLTLTPATRLGGRAPTEVSFLDKDGKRVDLAAFRGKVVIVDFWATWCVPCRKEMASFDRVQEKLGPLGLVVAPVSLDMRGIEAVDAFYRDIGVRNLPEYVDDTHESAKAMGFIGIPSAAVFDRQGREAFRVEGAIDWSGPAATMRLQTLLKQ